MSMPSIILHGGFIMFKTTEKGQALILITLAAVGLFAFAALAIDGSRVYSTRRHAQNAADTAALAGALVYTRDNANLAAVEQAAEERLESNGYNDDGISNDVTVTINNVPSGECRGGTPGKDITVDIVANVETTIARVIGRNLVTTAVTATTRACGFYRAPLFNGYPIVGLNPDQAMDPKSCGFTTGNSGSVDWEVEGGGIFSNGCAFSKDADAVNFHGDCAASAGPAQGFDCQTPNETSMFIDYPADVDAIMPPNPCDGTPGDIGKPQGTGSLFSNGVYCISDLDALDKKDITLSNATLYVTDTAFNLKFAGGGGFYGSATQQNGYAGSGPYEGYYMVITRIATPCPDFAHGDQVIEWRGNGSGTYAGTVLAPSACLDVRGNGNPSGMNTQLIAYIVGSNGNADVYVNYNPDNNRREPVDPTISVWE
jgi:Flp pilus assembly protein TadG